MHIISKVELNHVYHRDYLIFLIPFMLVVGDALSLYDKGEKQLYLHQILTITLKKARAVSLKPHQ